VNEKTWVCDTCGEAIQRVENGWVEWLVKDNGNRKFVGHGLRLVHHQPASPRDPRGSCQYDGDKEFLNDGSTINDNALGSFLGADGLMELLSFLADDKIAKDEVLEMIKRLHIPGYEHARFRFDEAISRGVFEPNTMPGYYWQSDIDAVLRFIEQEH
jgi:hypothetical protein